MPEPVESSSRRSPMLRRYGLVAIIGILLWALVRTVSLVANTPVGPALVPVRYFGGYLSKKPVLLPSPVETDHAAVLSPSPSSTPTPTPVPPTAPPPPQETTAPSSTTPVQQQPPPPPPPTTTLATSASTEVPSVTSVSSGSSPTSATPADSNIKITENNASLLNPNVSSSESSSNQITAATTSPPRLLHLQLKLNPHVYAATWLAPSFTEGAQDHQLAWDRLFPWHEGTILLPPPPSSMSSGSRSDGGSSSSSSISNPQQQQDEFRSAYPSCRHSPGVLFADDVLFVTRKSKVGAQFVSLALVRGSRTFLNGSKEEDVILFVSRSTKVLHFWRAQRFEPFTFLSAELMELKQQLLNATSAPSPNVSLQLWDQYPEGVFWGFDLHAAQPGDVFEDTIEAGSQYVEAGLLGQPWATSSTATSTKTTKEEEGVTPPPLPPVSGPVPWILPIFPNDEVSKVSEIQVLVKDLLSTSTAWTTTKDKHGDKKKTFGIVRLQPGVVYRARRVYFPEIRHSALTPCAVPFMRDLLSVVNNSILEQQQQQQQQQRVQKGQEQEEKGGSEESKTSRSNSDSNHDNDKEEEKTRREQHLSHQLNVSRMAMENFGNVSWKFPLLTPPPRRIALLKMSGLHSHTPWRSYTYSRKFVELLANRGFVFMSPISLSLKEKMYYISNADEIIVSWGGLSYITSAIVEGALLIDKKNDEQDLLGPGQQQHDGDDKSSSGGASGSGLNVTMLIHPGYEFEYTAYAEWLYELRHQQGGNKSTMLANPSPEAAKKIYPRVWYDDGHKFCVACRELCPVVRRSLRAKYIQVASLENITADDLVFANASTPTNCWSTSSVGGKGVST